MVKFIKNPFKKEDPIKLDLQRDFADYLMERGFKPEESHKIAKEFWDKNYKKLKEMVK